MRFDLVAGDLDPVIQERLDNPSRVALPAGSTVEFAMVQCDGGKRVVGTGVIDDLTIPMVHYAWQAGDTDVPGVYRAQWRVRVGGGTGPLETWPSDEPFYVVIHPSLDSPISASVVTERVRVNLS